VLLCEVGGLVERVQGVYLHCHAHFALASLRRSFGMGWCFRIGMCVWRGSIGEA